MKFRAPIRGRARRASELGRFEVTSEHGDHSPRALADWSARYRFDARSEWRDCRIIDLSFEGATVELDGVALDEPATDRLDIEIDSIAKDQIGVTLCTVIRRAYRSSACRVVAELGFAHSRREESLLLHLLLALRNYV